MDKDVTKFEGINDHYAFCFPADVTKKQFETGHNYGFQRLRMCFCENCANGDPIHCSETKFCGDWKGPKKRGTAGSDSPVDFPKTRNRTKSYLEHQIKDTKAMFDDILSFTKEF